MNIVQINNSIQNVIGRYIEDRGYKDSVYFDSKFMIQSSSIMFILMMKEGIYKTEPFKMVFPNEFLTACDEDEAVKMVCDLFKIVIHQIEKIEQRCANDDNLTLKFESTK